MNNLKQYILEKLHLNKDIENNYFLIVYSNRDSKTYTKIFDDVIDAQNWCIDKSHNFWDGYVSKDLDFLKELEELINDDPAMIIVSKFLEKYKKKWIGYIKYIQKPEINKILQKD